MEIKYENLKPDFDNCNFTVDVLNEVCGEVFKNYLSNTTLFCALSGAKGFGKSFFICLLAWFNVCNYKDYNALLARYTFASARTSYYSMLLRVAQVLAEKGVTILNKIEEKEIKIYNSENRCEIVFPNKRVIRVIGFDNTSKWEGVAAPIGEWGMFALDEVIPMDGPIQDESQYMYQLNNMLIQIMRGQNLTTSNECLEELKDGDFQMFKKRIVLYGFNNHDTDHPIYQYYVQRNLPLTEDRKKQLDEDGYIVHVSNNFYGGGATIIRGTTKLNYSNLSDDLLEFAEGLKEEAPEQYETLFMGSENEKQIDQYSYKKDLLENAQFFDPEEFWFESDKRYWFDRITIGCDYADGGQLGDDASMVMLGFEFYQTGIVKEIYVLEQLSINTRAFTDMTNKVAFIAKHIANWSTKYMHHNKIPFEESMAFKIGHDAKTAKDFMKKQLVDDHNFDKNILDAGMGIFHASGTYGWPIADRHYVIKRLLNEKKIFFSKNLAVKAKFNEDEVILKKHGHLYNELEKCLNHPDKKLRDERPKYNKLDNINAFEHALSFFRYLLFE